jgi:hypothetical protein
MFEDMPQEWSAIFFYVVVPELKQAQSGRESDGRNEGTPDEKVDDQRDEWHDVCLPMKHLENHNDVVEKCEDKLGNPLAWKEILVMLCVHTTAIGNPSCQSPLLGPPPQ